MKDITFGSVCSGIEAASVAWHRFGWRASWLAEVSTWPARALHHHYGSGRPHFMLDPNEEGLSDEERNDRLIAIKTVAKLPLVPMNSKTTPPNLGDMTRIEALVRSGAVAAPDILCGGTPCQAFSLAGLRASMEDARGQLTLSFVRLADAIDTARHVRGEPPAIIVWENVFGVMSTKDNAFGAFVGALAGEDSPLIPPGAGWTNTGCVFGPRRTVAWRVYDAQYFGVAQRRRRVFVVASAREGIDPSEILFEFDGVRRDTAPSRQTGQDVTGTIRASAARRGGVQDECGLGLQPVTGTLDASYGRLQGCAGQDANHGHSHLVVASVGNNQAGPIEVATACRAHASPHLDFESETFLVQSVALRGRDGGATAELGDDLAGAQRASSGGSDKAHVLAPIAFDSRQDCISSTEVFGALGSSSPQAQAVAFSCKDSGADASVELAPTMRAMGHQGSHANGGGQIAVCVTGEITHTLKAEGFDASEDGTGRGQPIIAHRMAVRRLTPRECERLQGFPDDYTLIPMGIVSQARAEKILAAGDHARQDDAGNWWKMAADGPRYKALGNSWAVPNVVWIGRRIDQALRAAA